ncbi:D-inositol-3-phosphate glycosyltransferase [Methylobacterium mesophilicum]|nr:D-inositol-3-phosphate glycosyltransferase [Methylobacterium mesophilicum]
MKARGSTAKLLAPRDAKDPGVEGLSLEIVEGFSGHLWEQTILPRFYSGNLINLCNTAPAFKSNQIVCIHDANVFEAPESYGTGFRVFYKTLQPLLVRRSAKIATVSEYSATRIAKHLHINASDIAILPNGHEHVFLWDSNRANKAPAVFLQQKDRSERQFVLALGSVARHKNLSFLVGLADKLSELNVDLVIAGGHADIFASEKIQCASNVHHIGVVTDHDLAYLFERALCLAFPSLTEGFGLPVLEAMALGCPVISTDRASLPEICGAAALLAPPDNPQIWIGHIKALLASNALRGELIERGLYQAKKFSWLNTAEGYLEYMDMTSIDATTSTEPSYDSIEIAVVIATLGRPHVVTETLRRIIDKQTHRAFKIIVSCTDPEDVGAAINWPNIVVLTGSAGLAAQRNRALEAIPRTAELVVFFDDDFVPAADWLEIAAKIFMMELDIVGFTGSVIADGIKGRGLTFEDSDHLIGQIGSVTPSRLVEPFSPYGCNMAFRLSAIGDLRFDERLVLYGWLEDRDFGAALKNKGGRIVKCSDAKGIHLGVKSGRIAGDRLGYSQVINPLYMLRKGTISRYQVANHIFKNVASNLLGSIWSKSYVDRRGRLRGNILGFLDAIFGFVEPERVLGVKRKNQ